MRKIYSICLFMLLFVAAGAQTKTTTVEFQKNNRTAFQNDFPFQAGTVEDAIADTMKKLGYKGTTVKGFTVYKGVRHPDLGSEAWDLYFMVERKSRKDKDNSTVTMMVSKGYDEFITKADDKIADKATAFLDSLRNSIAVYDLEQQIVSQENEVVKADKKNTNLQEEFKDLEKKKKKLEEQIKDNIKAQENQVKEMENQKQILETLKLRRVNRS